MATGTVILRPSADISLKHTVSTGDGTGYSMISEATADDDSTYIYHRIASETSTSLTSTFSVSGTFPKEKYEITGITLYARSASSPARGVKSKALNIKLSYKKTQSSGGIQATLNEGYTTDQGNANDLVSSINKALKKNNTFPLQDLKLSVISSGSSTLDPKWQFPSEFSIKITQIYIEVQYKTIEVVVTEKIFLKENNAYVQYTTAYKKENGVWKKVPFSSLFPNPSNGAKTNFVRKKT